ncbi:MAG: hypothetical protein H3C38_05895 [Rhodospirillales bacterium]|nr:hypothetical protein [Rhodospirillales bacterium]
MPEHDEEHRPATSDKGRARSAERQERLAAALRTNLTRRKAQARTRAEEPRQPDETDTAEG